MRRCSILVLLAACGSPAGGPDGGGGGDDVDAQPEAIITDPFDGLPNGTAQWTALCARGYDDQISNAFCDGRTTPPVLTSLTDLYQLLGVHFDYTTPGNSNVRVTFNAHSTALPQRHTSPLNPRLFVFTPPLGGTPNPRYMVLAFARGEAFLEMVANDPSANNTLRFFAFRFHPACEQTAAGCNHADLYTPTIESGWTGWTLYDDEDVKNTTLDCRQCHQPNGPGTRKMLRMQELDGPWLHWFYEEILDNRNMIDQVYLVARPNERYGGVPSSWVHPSRPIVLQQLLINNGFGTQPNKFDSATIQTELQNTGTSPTWNAIYARAVAGDQIMVPYYGVPHTDPVKIADATTAYREVMTGARPPDQLPDLADVFLDAAEPAMSHRPKAGLDAHGILAHMCRHCHNSNLDQTISRSRFNVDTVDQLAPSIRAEAIRRLSLPEADIRHMPPRRFHSLSDAERQLVIDYLSQ